MKTFKVVPDDGYSNPLEDETCFVISYTSQKYTLGTERVNDPFEVAKKAAFRLPVYAYIHSGVVLSCTPFSCMWDSGQSGEVYITRERLKEYFGWKRLSKKRKASLAAQMSDFVDYVSDVLNGNVYGYKIFEDGQEIDSCWGFVGTNWEENGIMDYLSYHFRDLKPENIEVTNL